ncbi:MAG: hypothetical protein DRJ02_12330 [Bacteroidetes bacterium]|nr:MAG: hypothetical protein DRJ02_12330 [Bacteroidota bacterium]
MINKLLITTVIFFAGLMTGFSQHTDLTIVIHGTQNNKGVIRIGVFSNADNFKVKTNPVDSAVVEINDKGSAIYTFHKLPPGTYAIAVYHDENNDGTLNKRQMGIPVEGIGFSNLTKSSRRPPDFEKVVFNLKEEPLTLEIPLFYNKKSH